MQLHFIPKKTIFRKFFRGRLSVQNKTNISLIYGTLGIQILENARLSTDQLESFRRVIRRLLKRKGKLLFIQKANLPLTAKPAEVRMGSGKGALSTWVVRVMKGSVLAELKGVHFQKAIKAIKKALSKLSIKSRIIFVK
jgi:large subunit ribosomal protein L16